MARWTSKRIRLVVGSLLVLLVLGLFGLDRWLETRVWVSAVITVVALAGFLEFAALSSLGSPAAGGSRLLAALGLLATAYFWGIAWWEGQGAHELSAGFYAAGVGGLVLAGFALLLPGRDPLRGFPHLLSTLLGVLALGWLLSYVLRVYQAGDPDTALVRGLVFFLGVKGTDIVAYLVGSAIGRHHFLKISPGKTLEGSVAALLFGALWFGLTGWLQPERFFEWPLGILFGIIIAVASALGDLSESLIKRYFQVKDSSRLLPEFGGVLDMIDSFLYTAFIFWCLL